MKKQSLSMINMACLSILSLIACTRQFEKNEQSVEASHSLQARSATITAVSAKTVFIDNDTTWLDTDGNEILAQGGCITQVSDTFHWFGPKFGNSGDYSFYAINHYTSVDLKNWTKQAPALTPTTPGIPFSSGHWVGRPWILWNPNTNRYVMVMEWGHGVRNNYVFFSSTSLYGPWTYHSNKRITQLPDINNVPYNLGDLGAYADGNTAWLLYTFDKDAANQSADDRNYSQAILKLDTDFMTPLPPVAGNYTEFSGGSWRAGVQEAAGVFKRKDTYYYFTSTCSSWNSSETRYRIATNMAGPWSANAIVPTNPSSATSFNTQHDFVLPVTGYAGTTYMYCGDRWSNYTGNGKGRNAWYPLSFDAAGVPTINGGDWLLDVGTASATPIALQNPGFENDFDNWIVTGNASIATDPAEVHPGGAKAVKSWSTAAYTTTLQNTAVTNAVAGTYTLTAYSRAGGSFNKRVLQVWVNGVKTEVALPATTRWAAYSINNINVPAGAAINIGVELDATARAWTQFDDFELTRN